VFPTKKNNTATPLHVSIAYRLLRCSLLVVVVIIAVAVVVVVAAAVVGSGNDDDGESLGRWSGRSSSPSVVAQLTMSRHDGRQPLALGR